MRGRSGVLARDDQEQRLPVKELTGKRWHACKKNALTAKRWQGSCVAGLVSSPVTIKNIEYAIIDRGFKEGWVKPRVPKVEPCTLNPEPRTPNPEP